MMMYHYNMQQIDQWFLSIIFIASIHCLQWVLSVPDSVTPCQGYDMCLDLRCGSCYDPYLGAHTSCGKLTYYDCNVNLPRECQPMRCTETNIHEVNTIIKL